MAKGARSTGKRNSPRIIARQGIREGLLDDPNSPEAEDFMERLKASIAGRSMVPGVVNRNGAPSIFVSSRRRGTIWPFGTIKPDHAYLVIGGSNEASAILLVSLGAKLEDVASDMNKMPQKVRELSPVLDEAAVELGKMDRIEQAIRMNEGGNHDEESRYGKGPRES